MLVRLLLLLQLAAGISFSLLFLVYFSIGLVWFYGISHIVGYLIQNPVFTYILNIWFLNTFCRYTQLNDQTVLFQIIKFSISQQS